MKVAYQNRVHKLAKDPDNVKDLLEQIKNIFKDCLPEYFKLEYKDNAGDIIIIHDNSDLQIAKQECIGKALKIEIKETQDQKLFQSMMDSFYIGQHGSPEVSLILQQEKQKTEKNIEEQSEQQIIKNQNQIEIENKQDQLIDQFEQKMNLIIQETEIQSNQQNNFLFQENLLNKQQQFKYTCYQCQRNLYQNQQNCTMCLSKGYLSEQDDLILLIQDVLKRNQQLQDEAQDQLKIKQPINEQIENQDKCQIIQNEQTKNNIKLITQSLKKPFIFLKQSISKIKEKLNNKQKQLDSTFECEMEQNIQVKLNESFIWRFSFKNNGLIQWPANTSMKCVEGPYKGFSEPVESIFPDFSVSYEAEFLAPDKLGKQLAVFQLCYKNGEQEECFGQKLRLEIEVIAENKQKGKQQQNSIICKEVEIKCKNLQSESLEIARKVKKQIPDLEIQQITKMIIDYALTEEPLEEIIETIKLNYDQFNKKK